MRLDVSAIEVLLVPIHASLRQAVEAIEKGGVHIALAMESDGRLIGVISDGDVRRALLAGATLEDGAKLHFQLDFVHAPAGASGAVLMKIARQRGVDAIPLVNETGHLAGMWTRATSGRRDDLPNRAVIMAGGKGTRLGARTVRTPKPLVPVAGLPMLERVLQMCVRSGLRRISLAVGHMSDQIVAYFGDGRQWDVDIEYLREEYPLGTAGALGSLVSDEKYPIVVLNADVLSDVDLRSLVNFHLEAHADATVCTRRYSIEIPYGVTDVDNGVIVGLREKPRVDVQVNAGIYVIAPHRIARIERGEALDMSDFLEAMVDEGLRVAAYPLYEFWVDAGEPATLEWASRRFERDND